MFHKAESEVAPVNCPHYSLCSSHAGLLAVPDKLQMDNGVSWCYTVCFGGTAKPFSKAVAPFNTPRAVDDGSDFSLFSPAFITGRFDSSHPILEDVKWYLTGFAL